MKFAFFTLSVLLLLGNSCSTKRLPQDGTVLKLDAVAGTITQADDKIVYSRWDTSINVYNIATQTTVFRKAISDVCYAKPVLKGDKIYFPLSNGKFVCIQFTTGAVLWQLDLKGRCSNFDFINDSIIVASVKHYGLLGINATDGETIYELKYDYAESRLPDLSPWPIVHDNDRFYVSNWQGNVLSAYDIKNGSLHWHFKNNNFGFAGKCVVNGSKLFFGINNSYQGGKFFVLDSNDGRVITEKDCRYEERAEPIVYGKTVYFYSYDHMLNRYDFDTNRLDTIKRFEKETDISGNQMFLAVDKIFFSDASFYINSYSIPKNTFTQVQSAEKSILGVLDYKGRTYFIN